MNNSNLLYETVELYINNISIGDNMKSKISRNREIEYLRSAILEMRQEGCNNVADLLCDELETLQGDIVL